jgi:hypothetical protein
VDLIYITTLSDDDDDDDDIDDHDDEDDEDDDDDEDRKQSKGQYIRPNIVEDYGIEEDVLPSDEGSVGEVRGKRRTAKSNRRIGRDPKSRKMAAGIGCCVIVLIILAVVLGVTLGGKDDPAPSPRGPSPTVAPSPTRPPVAPESPAPTIATASPTLEPLREKLTIESLADTYIYLGASEENVGPFGQELFVLVQNDVQQSPTIALIQFDISHIPDPERIKDFPVTATMVMQVVDAESLPGTVTIETMRFQSSVVDIEGLPSFQDPDALDQFAVVLGPSFDITPNTTEISVDITDLIFEQPLFLRGRRLVTVRDQLFLGIMFQPKGLDEAASLKFSSLEGTFPPQLEIRIELPLTANITEPSPAPSSSTSPTSSSAPTASSAPSAGPTVSASPASWAYFCNICGEGQNITNPNGPLDLPDIGEVTCQGLQTIGDWGGISEENCNGLLPIVNFMCCGELFVCSICSDGSEITNPDAAIQDGSTCATLVSNAAVGLISEVDCPAVQATTAKKCCDLEL